MLEIEISSLVEQDFLEAFEFQKFAPIPEYSLVLHLEN